MRYIGICFRFGSSGFSITSPKKADFWISFSRSLALMPLFCSLDPQHPGCLMFCMQTQSIISGIVRMILLGWLPSNRAITIIPSLLHSEPDSVKPLHLCAAKRHSTRLRPLFRVRTVIVEENLETAAKRRGGEHPSLQQRNLTSDIAHRPRACWRFVCSVLVRPACFVLTPQPILQLLRDSIAEALGGKHLDVGYPGQHPAGRVPSARLSPAKQGPTMPYPDSH